MRPLGPGPTGPGWVIFGEEGEGRGTRMGDRCGPYGRFRIIVLDKGRVLPWAPPRVLPWAPHRVLPWAPPKGPPLGLQKGPSLGLPASCRGGHRPAVGGGIGQKALFSKKKLRKYMPAVRGGISQKAPLFEKNFRKTMVLAPNRLPFWVLKPPPEAHEKHMKIHACCRGGA